MLSSVGAILNPGNAKFGLRILDLILRQGYLSDLKAAHYIIRGLLVSGKALGGGLCENKGPA